MRQINLIKQWFCSDLCFEGFLSCWKRLNFISVYITQDDSNAVRVIQIIKVYIRGGAIVLEHR